MCHSPIQIDATTKVACRRCDECISTRMQHWVARSMAEAAMHRHTYALTLTYADDTEENRRGARSFRYSDVRAFNNRLARQMHFQHGARSPRFLVTGENGKEKGRVHWHMINYHSHDLLRLGEWRKYGRKWEGARMGRDNRLNWSLWPHGYVEIQEPDDCGMAYVLKYAFKDQFTTKRAEGTLREKHAKDVSTGMFRMSKGAQIGEAIGEPWLWREVDGLLEKGQFPASFDFKVPNYWGYWHVTRQQRQNLLDKLRIALSEMGHKPAQYDALLSKMSDRERLEFTGDGERIEQEQEQERQRDRLFGRRDQEQRRFLSEVESQRRKCGAQTPCASCCKILDQRSFDAATEVSKDRSTDYRQNGQHPYCAERHATSWAFSTEADRAVRSSNRPLPR